VALRNTREYLFPGARFRFVVPDLEQLAKDYLASADDDAAIRFMESTSLGVHRRPTGMEGLLCTWLGNSAHLWMWDFKSMADELRNAGFDRIRRAFYADAQDPMFKDVESRDRWEGSLGIECYRPHE
jgi:hypothetical protein